MIMFYLRLGGFIRICCILVHLMQNFPSCKFVNTVEDSKYARWNLDYKMDASSQMQYTLVYFLKFYLKFYIDRMSWNLEKIPSTCIDNSLSLLEGFFQALKLKFSLNEIIDKETRWSKKRVFTCSCWLLIQWIVSQSNSLILWDSKPL